MASYPTFTDRTVHSVEARPQGSVEFDLSGMSLRLLGGVDLYHARLNGDVYSDKNLATKTRGFEFSQWIIGPYLTARFAPLPILFVSAGARFDTALTKAAKDDGTVEGDKTHHAFVYDAGIVLNPLTDLKVYAKFATLFRYPFVDELAQIQGIYEKFNNNLEPEKGFNAEIGAAYRLGTLLDVYGNFFFMRLEDEIGAAYLNPSNPYDVTNVNLDKTQRLGTNIGLTFRPIDLVSLDTSYSFVNAIFIDGVNKDKQVPMVPQHKLYGSVMAHLPFGLSFGPDVEYVSGSYYGQDYGNQAETMDGYFLLGARARYVLDREQGRFALQITAKNLLGTKYAAYGTTYFDSVVANDWVYTLYPADGRSINVSLQYRF
jgi:iron complex outermembrane receptor protein